MEKLITWVKANLLLVIAGLVVVAVLFIKPVKRFVFGAPRRKVVRRVSVSTRSAIVRRPATKSNNKPLPRSVNTKGYPKYGGGFIPFVRNKDGSIKKAKFVSGTLAAHNYMKNLRKSR
jgi:hypothetical protein